MAKLLWQTGVLLSNFIRPAFLKNKLCRYVIKNAKLAVNNLREYVFVMECILYKRTRLHNLKASEKWYTTRIHRLISYEQKKV